MEPAAVEDRCHSAWTTERTAGYAMAIVEPAARAAHRPTSQSVSPRTRPCRDVSVYLTPGPGRVTTRTGRDARGSSRSGKVIARDVQMDVVARFRLEGDLARAEEHHGVDLGEALHERGHLRGDHGQSGHAERAAHFAGRDHEQRPSPRPAEHAPGPVVDGNLGQAEELLIALGRLLRVATADDEPLEAHGRVRMLGGRRRGGQLHENARARGRTEKGDAPGQPLARRLVDQGDTPRLEAREIALDIGRLEAHVMEPFAALGEEAGHPALRARGLEELDLAVAGRQQRRPHALVRDLRLAQEGQPERVAPEAIRPREALDHDADVVDLLDHALSHPIRPSEDYVSMTT